MRNHEVAAEHQRSAPRPGERIRSPRGAWHAPRATGKAAAMDSNPSDVMDRLAIRELIENWVVWRDAGDWERFATVWHDDGVMMATWFQGPAAEFIRVTKEGWAKGVSILHSLGGTSIELAGDRAVAQTKMTLSQRGDVHGVS